MAAGDAWTSMRVLRPPMGAIRRARKGTCLVGGVEAVLCLRAPPQQRKAADKAETKGKKGAKKDKNAPKRALSAYMFFSQDWRERVKAENPDASFGEFPSVLAVVFGEVDTDRVDVCAFAGEIGKLLGARWKELDDEEKKVRCYEEMLMCFGSQVALQPYIEQAAKDKERAEKEKKEYDVRCLPICVHLSSPTLTLAFVVQNKKIESASGDEDDDE